MWKNLKGESSDFPTVVTRTVEVPQQTNAYDCGFFVMHMMKLFLEQAPERFKMENVEMFSKNWFKPEEASALREEIRPVLEEELKRYCASTNSAIYPVDERTKPTVNSPHVSSSPHPATLEEALISSVQPQPSTSLVPNFDVSLCSADFDEQSPTAKNDLKDKVTTLDECPLSSTSQVPNFDGSLCSADIDRLSPTAKNDLKAPLCSAEPPVYNKKKFNKIMYTRKRLKGSTSDLKAEPPVYNKKKYNKIMYSRKRLKRLPFVSLDNVQISGTLEAWSKAS